MITSRTAGSSGMSSLRSGPTCTWANMPRVGPSRAPAADDLRPCFLRPVLQPVGVLAGHLLHRRGGRVPVPGPLRVQVRGLVRQQRQRVREVPDGVARGGDAEPDVLPLDSPVRRLEGGRGAEEDRPGEPPGDLPRAQRRAGRVDPGGRGRRAVDVGVDHRLEAVLQVLRDLRQHVVGVQRHPARHDQRRGIVPLVQLVNDRGHQPQHATGALEPVQRRPVVVQPVEQLRVDRVRRRDPLLIRRLGDARTGTRPGSSRRSR